MAKVKLKVQKQMKLVVCGFSRTQAETQTVRIVKKKHSSSPDRPRASVYTTYRNMYRNIVIICKVEKTTEVCWWRDPRHL